MSPKTEFEKDTDHRIDDEKVSASKGHFLLSSEAVETLERLGKKFLKGNASKMNYDVFRQAEVDLDNNVMVEMANADVDEKTLEVLDKAYGLVSHYARILIDIEPKDVPKELGADVKFVGRTLCKIANWAGGHCP